jgi:thiol-disulfide isomerase/thioredoxin
MKGHQIKESSAIGIFKRNNNFVLQIIAMKNLLLLLILFRCASLHAEEGIQFAKGTFSEALIESGKQDKLIFVDCYTTWCGPCKWMASKVFTEENVANSFNKNFICVAFDMEKGEGLELAKKYNVKNYPTFLWIDQTGKQIHRSVGSTNPDDFLAIANNAMSPKKNLDYLKNEYDKGNRQHELLLDYATTLKSAYDMNYQTVADEYFKLLTQKELAEEKTWNAILEFTPNIQSYTYAAITKSLPTFYERYGKDSVNNVLDQLAISSLSYARQQKDSVMLKKAIDKLKESNNKDILKQALSEEMNYYKGNKNYARYAELAHEYIDKHFKDDAKTLNAVSWTYFQHINDKKQLADAERWISRSVALEEMYYNTDTYANLLHKLDKKKEAIAMAKHSIELAKKEGEDYSGTQELLDTLMKGD